MIRVEIYANMELLEELQNEFVTKVPTYYYSVFPLIKAYGKRGYAFGDSVWPESNFCCMFMLEDGSDIHILQEICDTIQKQSPQNSMKMFAYKIEMVDSKGTHTNARDFSM